LFGASIGDGAPPTARAIFRALRTACASPSIAKILSSSGGTVTPLNVCNGCIEPTAAPRARAACKTVESSAPLVCRITWPLSSSSPIRVSSSATLATAESGVAIKMHVDAKICRDIVASGVPSPMNRTARRALDSFRVTTAPIFQPSSRRRRPNARPTRPAPTIARVSLMNQAYREGCAGHQPSAEHAIRPGSQDLENVRTWGAAGCAPTYLDGARTAMGVAASAVHI
jgi:hypothetical protein